MQEASRRNRAIGQRGRHAGFWIEARLPDGAWTVEFRVEKRSRDEKRSWWSRFWSFVWEAITGYW